MKFSIAAIAITTLGGLWTLGGIHAVPPSRLHLDCSAAADDPRPLSPSTLIDRWHLRNDVETAEGIGVRFGDSKRKALGRDGEHLSQRACTDKLLAAVAGRHNLNFAEVVQLRGKRPVGVDVGVLMVFSVFFVTGVQRVCGVLVDRVSRASVWHWVAGVMAAVAAGSVAVGGLTMLGLAVETVRLWDFHMSYRAGRLPWEQHRSLVFVFSFMVFWIALGAVAYRSDRQDSVAAHGF